MTTFPRAFINEGCRWQHNHRPDEADVPRGFSPARELIPSLMLSEAG
ncbi:hypothetical protein [Streptomyces sp. NBC_01794]|nr:hypothetical protein OIE54_09660 [Streptomyces sp. NBC_01794]